MTDRRTERFESTLLKIAVATPPNTLTDLQMFAHRVQDLAKTVLFEEGSEQLIVVFCDTCQRYHAVDKLMKEKE